MLIINSCDLTGIPRINVSTRRMTREIGGGNARGKERERRQIEETRLPLFRHGINGAERGSFNAFRKLAWNVYIRACAFNSCTITKHNQQGDLKQGLQRWMLILSFHPVLSLRVNEKIRNEILICLSWKHCGKWRRDSIEKSRGGEKNIKFNYETIDDIIEIRILKLLIYNFFLNISI